MCEYFIFLEKLLASFLEAADYSCLIWGHSKMNQIALLHQNKVHLRSLNYSLLIIIEKHTKNKIPSSLILRELYQSLYSFCKYQVAVSLNLLYI